MSRAVLSQLPAGPRALGGPVSEGGELQKARVGGSSESARQKAMGKTGLII